MSQTVLQCLQWLANDSQSPLSLGAPLEFTSSESKAEQIPNSRTACKPNCKKAELKFEPKFEPKFESISKVFYTGIQHGFNSNLCMHDIFLHFTYHDREIDGKECCIPE